MFTSICASLVNNSFTKETNNSSDLKYLSFPFNIVLPNSKNNKKLAIKSGNPFIIDFILIDCHNQTVIFDDNSIGNLNSQPLNMSQSVKLKAGSTKAENGILNFINISVYIYPGSSFEIIITLNLYNLLIRSPQKLQNSFIFQTINCSDGEILLIDMSCYACPIGFYSSNDFSFEIPNICLPCPANAECQGNLIIPQPGYWRGHKESSLIVQCLILGACLGNYTINGNTAYTQCYPNQGDNLCNLCDYGYGKYTSLSTCEKCQNINGSQIGRAIAIIILAIIYIFHSSKSITSKEDDDDNDYIDVVVKIFINHMQRISIIMISEVEFEISLASLKSYVNYFGYLSLITEDVFSNDCFLQMIFTNMGNFPFYKILITLMLPILIASICFILFSFIIIKNSISAKKIQNPLYLQKFIIFFLVCTFLCYSMLIKCSMDLLNCISLTNDPLTQNNSFLYDSPDFQCWVGLHRYGAAPSGILGIIIWGFCFPLFLWHIIGNSLKMKNTKNIMLVKLEKKSSNFKDKNEALNNNNFRFFIKDYKRQYYYWESIVFIHKLLLYIFSQINHWSNEIYLRMFNVLFLLFYFGIIHQLQPFALRKINYLEYMSLISAVFTNIATIVLSSEGISAWYMYFLYVVTLLSNGFFFGFGIFLVVRHTKWKKMYSDKKKNLIGMKNLLNLRVHALTNKFI